MNYQVVDVIRCEESDSIVVTDKTKEFDIESLHNCLFTISKLKCTPRSFSNYVWKLEKIYPSEVTTFVIITTSNRVEYNESESMICKVLGVTSDDRIVISYDKFQNCVLNIIKC